MLRSLLISAFVTMSACLSGALCAAESGESMMHSFLATGAKTFIMQFSAEEPQGKIVWEYPAATREGWVLPGGNVLLALTKSPTYPGGAAVEVTRDHKIVWEYKGTQGELNSVQKTAAGTYVVTESGKEPRLLELDAAGKALVQFPLACQTVNTHMETRMARKLPDGTYLAPHLFDFAVKQYSKTGEVLKTIDTTIEGDPERKIHSWPFTAIRLSNGNTLCGLTHANRVAEFDPNGKKVWEVTNDDVGGIIKDACGVQRLPNGNTIINSFAARANEVKLFEITRDKRIVWRFSSPEPKGIHHFHVIDTNGIPLPGSALR
jgi:hypothetical protein